jgi:hypothetical protein
MDAHEEDVFPNDDFFPDTDNLFSDMSLSGNNILTTVHPLYQHRM